VTLVDSIRAKIRGRGFDVVRYKPRFEHPIDLLGLLVRDELTRDPDFVFVQVGANDGELDPLRPLVLRHQLRGLLIEPLPDAFARLQQTYADQPGLMFENCAIAEHDGEQVMYRIRADAPVPIHMHLMAGFNREHLSAATDVPGIDGYIERIIVPAHRLASVIHRHGFTRISLLMVDTEGYDAQVVEAALADGLRPANIMYEHCHLSHMTQLACTQHLKRCGYRFVENGMDTYAVLDRPTD